MSDKAVTKYTTDHGEVALSPQIIRTYLVNGNGAVTNQEIMMFMALCKFQRLNPFLREAYLIKYGDSPATMITGRDVFTKRAAKNGSYDGMESGVVVMLDGKPEERAGAAVYKGEELVGGWARVHRKDQHIPTYVSVAFDEYAARKRNGELNSQWTKMPGTMIVKVAEVQALRKAFPEDFQGLYDQAEMSVDTELPTSSVESKVTPDYEAGASDAFDQAEHGEEPVLPDPEPADAVGRQAEADDVELF